MFFLDNFLKGIKPRYDDDFIDRMNYYYTPMILVILALTMSAKQYVGQPIQCWVPAQFTGAWEQYTENYCFVQNTYFLPLTDYIPKSYADRDVREIGYYQWVPFVLALMALMFFLPNLIWRLFNWQSGINVKSIIRMSLDSCNASVEAESREKNVKVVAAHIQDCLELQRELKPSGRMLGFMFYGKRYGVYITYLYIVVKMLFVINIIGQFFVLNNFLGFPHHQMWGFEVLKDLANGREWPESGHFPRVTMCDFEVRVLGNLHRYTVQCVLMINMFNEKIFVFLWWWFVIMAFATILNMIIWFVHLLGGSERAFVTRYLRVTERLTGDDKDSVKRFVNSSLRRDGVLLLRLIANNAGDVVCTDLIHKLWSEYKERRGAEPQAYDPGIVETLEFDGKKKIGKV